MNDRKIFWIDTETTGLDSIKHDIIQLSCLVEINGKIETKEDFLCQPFSYTNIDPVALQINNTTIEDLKSRQTPQEMHCKLKTVMHKYIDNYTKGHAKFSPAGFNVRFDVDFLREFFIKNNDKYYNSYFDYHLLSVDSLLNILEYRGLLDLENHKLITACKHFGIELDAHNALSDITATRKILYKMFQYFKETE